MLVQLTKVTIKLVIVTTSMVFVNKKREHFDSSRQKAKLSKKDYYFRQIQSFPGLQVRHQLDPILHLPRIPFLTILKCSMDCGRLHNSSLFPFAPFDISTRRHTY